MAEISNLHSFLHSRSQVVLRSESHQTHWRIIQISASSGAVSTRGVLLTLSTSAESVEATINSLHDSNYVVRQPIPISIEWDGHGEFLASFPEAGMSMPGCSAYEAISLLREHIVAMYEILREEDQLGPWPRQQLHILERYIGEKGR